MTRALRTLGHVVRADFLERARRHGFLVTLVITLYFAYVFLPPATASYVTFQVGGHRGVYGSAWIGAAVSMLAATFLSLAGFFLVKNAVERDRATGVGQILASTPLSKPLYTLGKAASNFCVLATLALLLVVGAAGMQLLRAEDTRVDVVALVAPFVVVTLPVLAIVAALAVLFETVRWLRGGLGNVVYVIVWLALMMSTLPRTHHFVGIGDFIGAEALLPSIVRATAAAFPDIDPRTVSMSMGFNFGARHHLATFTWAGPEWTAHVFAARLAWASFGVLLALAAALPFDRFDGAVVARAPRRARATRSGPGPTNADMAATPAPHASAAALPGARRGAAFVPLLRGELLLMLRRQPPGWWLIALGLVVASAVAPLAIARAWLLPFAWIWPLLVWSPLGARAALHRTELLLHSSPHPLARQLAAEWTAGALVAIGMGAPIAIRLLAAGDAAATLAWLIGAAFIPTLAVASGTWTGNGRMFEVVYLLLWYVGPMNHVPMLDYIGTTEAALGAGAPATFAMATAALAAAAVFGRKQRLQA